MAGLDRISGTAEGEGVIYEPDNGRRPEYKTLEQAKAEVAKEDAEAAKANLHSRFDGPGVAVELSTQAVQASETAKKQAARGESSILDILRDTWKQFVEFIKGIWNGGEEVAVSEAEAVAAEDEDITTTDVEIGEKTSAASDEVVKASVKQQNSPEEIAAFLADYGGRHLAKNSDLLTQYDRSGKIVGPSPSDRRRILQGEGKVQKY